MNRRQQTVNETLDATYRRVHDNPNAHDIHSGDALNVVLTELANPKIYTQVVQKSTQPIDSQLVKTINFQYAPNMILISLDDLSQRGVPEVLATGPEFETDRRAIRALIAKARKEGESSNQITAATLRQFRAAVMAAKAKVDSSIAQGTRQRSEADNFLKALIGLSKMLERPQVEQFLKGLNRFPSTTMGHLITFMHNFNLRFGVAKTPEQEAAYDQLYPMLVQLRDRAQAGGPNLVATAQAPLPNPKVANALFSGIQLNEPQRQAPPRATPPPPAAGITK